MITQSAQELNPIQMSFIMHTVLNINFFSKFSRNSEACAEDSPLYTTEIRFSVFASFFHIQNKRDEVNMYTIFSVNSEIERGKFVYYHRNC